MIRITNTTNTPIPDDAILRLSNWRQILTSEGNMWVRGDLTIELFNETTYAEWQYDTDLPVYFLKDGYEKHGVYLEGYYLFKMSYDSFLKERLFVTLFPVLSLQDYDEREEKTDYECLPSDIPFSFVDWCALWDLNISYLRKKIVDDIIKNSSLIEGQYSLDDNEALYRLMKYIKKDPSISDELKLFIESFGI